MSPLDFVLLYASDVLRSSAFWAEVVGGPPVEASPGFAMFVLPNGVRLGLWLASEIVPAATAPGGTEVCFTRDSRAAVDTTHADWTARGWVILQSPTEMDFGYTFTAADPDGHRVRIFVPEAR